MVWCSYCVKDQIAERDDINGFTCCTGCGRVLDDNVYSSDPTFQKGSDGSSQLAGNIVRANQYGTYTRIGNDTDGYVYQSASHERTLERGRNEIREIADTLSIGGRDDAVGAAHRLYVLAVEKSFTKGRRTQQVAAACLYIVCRQENKPYLLIDFSDSLQVNVYVLGAVFLQLCLLLRLEQHPIIQKPVDPSLFIHRFTDRLLGLSHGTFGKKHHAIANTALRIVASMKRDWLQTGRKPSGICGAALYISAHIHGIECSKSDVVSVVHVCEATLSKRLVEFGNTESGSLTPEEFEEKARELELTAVQPVLNLNSKGEPVINEILCEHKELGAAHHAHGLCKTCYDEFMKVSGGLEGEDPPAFQRSEKKRIQAEKRKLKAIMEDPDEYPPQKRHAHKAAKMDMSVLEDFQELDNINETCESTISDAHQEMNPQDEVETLSDIDDDEVNAYLNNEEEVRLKTIVWTEMNKEYIQELEAKEAAIAACEAAQAAALSAASGSGTAAEIAAAAAVAIANSKKVKKQKQRTEKKPPAESAAEAARQMLESKRLSSRVNFDVLEKLFDGEENTHQGVKLSPESSKRVHFADDVSGLATEDIKLDTQKDDENVKQDTQKDNENDVEEDEDGGEEYNPMLYGQEEEEYYEEY